MKLASTTLLAFASFLSLVGTASAQTYYVDFGTTSGAASTGNIYNWSSTSASGISTGLINYATGAVSGIRVAISGAEFASSSPSGSATVTGGLALQYVSPAGMNLMSGINGGVSFPTTLTITGLDYTNFTYELTLFGNRANGSSATTYFTISDVSTFSNVSDGSISTSVVTNDRTLILAGNNTAGTAARFAGINPGSDNDIVINLTTDNTRWYLNAMNLTAVAIPEPSSFAALAGLACAGFAVTRRRRS